MVYEAITGMAPGKYCNIILEEDPTSGQCTHVVNVGDGGKATINLGPMSALALQSGAKVM